MTGKHENKSGRCPICGGRLIPDQTATIPFILADTIVVVKDVPAEICANCHEPYLTGAVTDRLVMLVQPAKALKSEVSVISYQKAVVPEAVAD